jgi:dihydropteroate synthase
VQVCTAAGISSDRILVDPGIGFGKKDSHNLELINALPRFEDIAAGILFGVSRKSMIGRLLGRDLSERLPGSLALALLALQRGAKILRVHDVAATADIVKIYQLTRA